ncbi:MAG: hypothetical protein ACK4MS_10800 [Paracoccaceae bacterium]
MRALAGVLTLLPSAAFACALPPSVILTLPTGQYIAGAALTVAVTALMGTMAGRLPQLGASLVLDRRVLVPVSVSSYLSFLCFLALVLIGLFGARDPMHNLMTLVFWTGVWIAVPLGSMLFGNLWRSINPWTAPVHITRTLLGRTSTIGLSRLGHWPAVTFYAGFVWFQLVSMSPDDPTVLATVALIYWLVIFGLAVAEGEIWLEQGEFLTVLMGFLAKVAPFWLELDENRARLMRGWPGAQVVRMSPLSVSAMAFITLALSALTFDGLMETFWWHGVIGENPLEPTGRSAVLASNTLGLVVVWAVTVGAIWTVMRAGQAIGGARFATGPVMLSFLAIAAGYHAAHYLVTLLTAGQYTLAALNDPLFRGDALLGLPPFYVSFGFLTDQTIMPMIYAVQFAAILGAHLLAVLLTLRLAGPTRALAHAPMTALMVGYTVLGLWLLSTARTG